MIKTGKFITVEGIEGAGKSTVMQFVHDLLCAHEVSVVMTREPGGTEIAEDIRQVLLHSSSEEKMQPETELLLMYAGRLQHIHHCIIPALAEGKYVVSDRYVDASYAYQGGGRGIPLERIDVLDKFVVNGLYPDLTLLLDLPAELGFSRTQKRSAHRDRIEQEALDFFERVRKVYLERAKQMPDRIKVIDASLDLPQVQEQIKSVVNHFIKTMK